jgi:hypothetical protein
MILKVYRINNEYDSFLERDLENIFLSHVKKLHNTILKSLF